MKKPSKCPKCGSKKVQEIVYGLVDDEYLKNAGDDIYFDGCMPTDAEWHCADCDWEWGPNWSGKYNPLEEDEEETK